MRPNLEHVIELTNAKAARVEDRCNYVVTGYVLTHIELAKKAVVDMAAVRWFPNVDEFTLMMTGRKLTPGPGVPPPEWGVDQLMAPSAPVGVPVGAPVVPSRAVLTAPPSARLLETTEAAIGELARELGCVRNEDVPHNAGWFVPGKPTAYASAYDAIRGLVASLKAGGTVYEGKPGSQEIEISASESVASKRNAPSPTIEQGALF
jgi:hypothetical protein